MELQETAGCRKDRELTRPERPGQMHNRGLVRLSGLILLCVVLLNLQVAAEDVSLLKGRVTDVGGKGADGARVFVYNSPDVRRPADFISSPADKNGLFRLPLPPGKYWAVARLKKTEGFGPLMPGDKHSGDPVEIELGPGREVSTDFTVADLREAIMSRTRTSEGPVKISGKIVGSDGSPLRRAYVFANAKEKEPGIPDYVSSWADEEGRFTLYVPKGRYYVGSALEFPPGRDYLIYKEMTLDTDKAGIVIVRGSGPVK